MELLVALLLKFLLELVKELEGKLVWALEVLVLLLMPSASLKKLNIELERRSAYYL